MSRDPDIFAKQNNESISLWSVTRPCHHRSTIQYWRFIVDDEKLRKAYQQFLYNEWITTDINYAKISGVSKWVGGNVLEIKNYFDLSNSSKYISTYAFGFMLFTFILIGF